jgi:uncharacterized protein DUF5681
MGWKRGQSGNPGGRPFGSEKEYTQALRIISKQEIDDPNNPGERVTKLRRMGEIVWDKALAGENWAIQHIAERFEGRPAQMLEYAGGGEMRVIVTSGLVREQQIVDADYQEAETVPPKLIGTKTNGTNGNGHG